MNKEQKQQLSTEPSNVLDTLLGAVSFYDKMPETNKPLKIIHNQTKEMHEAIATPYGLWVNGSRVSGCYYSWVYSNCT